jgi:hypothetical protein
MVGRDTPYGARLANDFVCFRQGKGLARLDVQKLTQINRSERVVVIEDRPWAYVRQPGARYFDVIERSGRIHVVGLIDGRLQRVASIIVDP